MATRTRKVESTGNIYTREVITGEVTETANVIFHTTHKDLKLEKIYNDFKESDNPALWLEENRAQLEKYDINVDNLKKATMTTDKPLFLTKEEE